MTASIIQKKSRWRDASDPSFLLNVLKLLRDKKIMSTFVVIKNYLAYII